jgi:hypothetical protein
MDAAMRPVVTIAQHMKNAAQQAPGRQVKSPVPFDDSIVALVGHRPSPSATNDPAVI